VSFNHHSFFLFSVKSERLTENKLELERENKRQNELERERERERDRDHESGKMRE